jgi:microcystin degradation protein MlrC
MNSASGVEAAVDVGVGSTVTTTVGGVLDHRFAEPLTLTGTVEHIFDARFQITRGHMAGMRFNMGKAATLKLSGNTKLIMTSSNGAHFAAELFALGLGVNDPDADPAQLQCVFNASMVVAKSPGGFRATYGRSAALILSCESPGCAPPRFWSNTYDAMYAHVRHEVFPWREPVDGFTPRATFSVSELAFATSESRL